MTFVDQEIQVRHSQQGKSLSGGGAAYPGEGASLVVASGARLAVPTEDGKALAEAVLQLYRMLLQEREAMGTKGHLFTTHNISRTICWSIS